MSDDLSKKTQSILKDLGHEITLASSSILVEELSSDLPKETPVTLQGKAELMLSYFEAKTRNNGDEFYSLKDDHPEWMKDACRKAHDEMMPDDYKYAFIHDALIAISNTETQEQLEDIRLEADIYTHDLLKWLSSNLHRSWYMDEAVQNFGSFKQFEHHLMAAQVIEKEEVLHSLIASLQEVEDV